MVEGKGRGQGSRSWVKVMGQGQGSRSMFEVKGQGHEETFNT